MLHECITPYSPCVHNVALGRTLIVPDRHVMVFGLKGHGERNVWAKITNRPRWIRETETQFPFLQTPKGFYPPIVAAFWIMNAWENKIKTRRLWSLFFFSPTAWSTLCLDSCSLCRCWHSAHVSFYKQINQYLLASQMQRSSTASSAGWYTISTYEAAGFVQRHIETAQCKATESRTYSIIN